MSNIRQIGIGSGGIGASTLTIAGMIAGSPFAPALPIFSNLNSPCQQDMVDLTIVGDNTITINAHTSVLLVILPVLLVPVITKTKSTGSDAGEVFEHGFLRIYGAHPVASMIINVSAAILGVQIIQI